MPSSETQSSLHEVLKDRLAAKGWNAEHLAKLSGLPESVINALLSGEAKRMPAAPYLQGYLNRIAPLLDLEARALFEAYRDEGAFKSAGPKDELPKNRYALGTGRRERALILGAAVLVILAYLGWRGVNLLRQPTLIMLYPAEETVIVAAPTIIVEGVADARDIVRVGGEEAPVAQDGRFRKEYALDPGVNIIEVISTRFLGKEARATRQVIYRP